MGLVMLKFRQGVDVRYLMRHTAISHRLQGGRHTWHVPKLDCYELFGIPTSATTKEIKDAYRACAKKIHPDAVLDNVDVHPNEAMVQLNLCYEALIKRRREYDAAKGVAPEPEFCRYAFSGGRGPWSHAAFYPYWPGVEFEDASMYEDAQIAREYARYWHQFSWDGRAEIVELLQARRKRKTALDNCKSA